VRASSGSRSTPLQIGTALAVASAVLFGVSTPFVQRFGRQVGPFSTAALLYLGAALASALGGDTHSLEAPVRRRHFWRLLAVALCGALVAPVCLAWGLQRTSATMASLLLASEAVFTVLLALALYREAIGGRVALAVLFISAGAVLLVADAGKLSAPAAVGSLAILGACLAWAADNVLSRPLADLDPRQVVRAKGALGGVLALLLAIGHGESVPGLAAALGLLITGGLAYGASLRLYLRAQRQLGAARTGSIFACAPFVGAMAAWALGDRAAGLGTLGAGGCIAIGIYLHASERHGHGHAHVAMEHEHAHRHDDGHHAHSHDPPVVGEHSHAHSHASEWHEHPHGPDVHHQHEH